MNKELLESQWTQIREILRDKFSNLTEEDIRQISGRYDQLVNKLQQKYGYSREEAEDRIRSWNFDRLSSAPRMTSSSSSYENKYSSKDEVRKEEAGSFFKWLLALGIPLLLLGAFFMNYNRTDMTNTTVAPTEQTMMETTADRTLAADLRNAFFAQNISGAVLQNVQITSRNGVVTLSGTVPTSEVRDTIVRTAQGFTGVRQVINNIIVR